MKIIDLPPAMRSVASGHSVLRAALLVLWVTLVGGLLALPADPLRAQDEEELPAAEDVTMVTSDGVRLNATWLPGTHEKETVPVIMLHGFGGGGKEQDRSSLLPMARYLQEKFGFSVLVPDLRGHGQSMSLEGSPEQFDIEKWRKPQIAAMVEDIEACKKFLIGKNNEGQLNIDLLTIVAESELAMHAAIWTLRDWSYGPIAGRKQGRDVKALVLIDPVRSFRGLNANDTFRAGMFTGDVGAAFPILIAAQRSSSRDAKTILGLWERGRKSLGVDKDSDHLDYTAYRIESQQRIVKRGNRVIPLAQVIGDFVQSEVFDRKRDFRWQDRSSK